MGLCVSRDRFVDSKTGDIKIEVTPEMREAAKQVVSYYNAMKQHYLEDPETLRELTRIFTPTEHAIMAMKANRLAGQNKMSEAVKSLLRSQRTRAGIDPEFKTRVEHFEDATFAANPHLDFRKMTQPDGTPNFHQRVNMEQAVGKVLNGVMLQAAEELALPGYPKIYSEAARAL
jgi:hypothetical protein